MTNPRRRPSDEELKNIFEIATRAALKSGAKHFEAQEVAQQTALKLFEKWDSETLVRTRTRGRDHWRNYIARAASNIHRDLIRSHQRRVARERKAVGTAGTPLYERPGVARIGPRDDSEVEQHLNRLALAEAIQMLPPRQRDCLMLYIQGLRISEVADLLGISHMVARRQVSRAKQTLIRHLAESGTVPSANAPPLAQRSSETQTLEHTRQKEPETESVFAIEEFGDALEDPGNIVARALSQLTESELQEFVIERR